MNSTQPLLNSRFKVFGIDFCYDQEVPIKTDYVPSASCVKISEEPDLKKSIKTQAYTNLNECLFHKPGILTSKITQDKGIEYLFNTSELCKFDRFCKITTHPVALFIFQMRDYVLHCSAVKKNNKAYLFIGPSGSGKSYLSGLMLNECKLITEDVGRIIFKDGASYIYPGLPFLKVGESFLKSSKVHFKEKFKVHGDTRDRCGLILDHQIRSAEPLLIDKCYFLQKSSQEKIEKATSIVSLKHLVLNSFRPFPRNTFQQSEEILLKNIGKLMESTSLYMYKRTFMEDPYKLLNHMDS